MGQYCFARWRPLSVVCRRRLSGSVTLPTGGPAGRRARGRSTCWPTGTSVVGRPTLRDGPVQLRPVRVTPCYRVLQCVLCFVYSVIVDELDISEQLYNQITRSRLKQFHAVRPALILFLAPLLFLPLPIVLGTKVCSSLCLNYSICVLLSAV